MASPLTEIPTANTIHLQGGYRKIEMPCGQNATAGITISPGMLVQQFGPSGIGGTAGWVQPQNTSGAQAEMLIALEDSLQGYTTANAYTSAGSTGFGLGTASGPDPVQIAGELPGNQVNLLLKGGYNYTIGKQLMANGDGTFIAWDSNTAHAVLAVVIDSLDLTSSYGGANALTRCRVL